MSTYISVNEVRVGIDFGNGIVPVGRLAVRDHKTYFEYAPDFIKLDWKYPRSNSPLVRDFKCSITKP